MQTLNRQLTLQEKSTLPDGAGGFVPGWSSLGQLWARIEARTARSVPHDEVSASIGAYRIIVRSAPVGAPSRPRAGQRLLEGSRIFTINGVADYDTGGHFLMLTAQEEVAQ